jgi:hypothetical protein
MRGRARPSLVSLLRSALCHRGFVAVFFSLCASCSAFHSAKPDGKASTEATGTVAAPQPPAPPVEAPFAQPVPLWVGGKVQGAVDLAKPRAAGEIVLDLGEDWTPYIFTERSNPTDTPTPQAYRPTYLALARGEFPKDLHGQRAKKDKYLELYGIAPTLTLLRTRYEEMQRRDCGSKIDLTPLQRYERIVPYVDNPRAKRDSSQFLGVEQRIKQLMAKKGVDSPAKLDASTLSSAEQALLRQYDKIAPTALMIRAVQTRLECEGFFDGKGSHVDGALDWSTNEAIAEFERKHRVFGWGFVSRDTVEAMATPPMEGERQAVLRVLTERAMHAAGYIEDGSTWSKPDKPPMFRGKDGKEHPVLNMEKEVGDALVRAFGLDTPESTLAWLKGLGDLRGNRLVAIQGPVPPEYYAQPIMDLSVIIDRGDVWYEFPYDDQGKERPQPTQRRPNVTLFTEYLGEKIPLARYGSTIGGWRSENIDGTEMWKYKNSPIGPRVWKQIVAAPVWLPPPGTTAKAVLTHPPGGKSTDWVVNLHEIGPSYASAYGLVAAYHAKFREGDDGELEVQGDEGIRTHGSVDYMSIMQRHSHGCHRLHNHIAVRLMSFVLAHRAHKRIGQRIVAYQSTVELDDQEYELKIDKTGYIFQLDQPLPVEVLEGRIRGIQKKPIADPLPKYDTTAQAYLMPDGSTVKVDRTGTITPIAPPPPAADTAAPAAEGILMPNGTVPASTTTTPPPAAP